MFLVPPCLLFLFVLRLAQFCPALSLKPTPDFSHCPAPPFLGPLLLLYIVNCDCSLLKIVTRHPYTASSLTITRPPSRTAIRSRPGCPRARPRLRTCPCSCPRPRRRRAVPTASAMHRGRHRPSQLAARRRSWPGTPAHFTQRPQRRRAPRVVAAQPPVHLRLQPRHH